MFSRDNLTFADKLEVINRYTGGTANYIYRKVMNKVTSETPGIHYPDFKWESKLVQHRLEELRDVTNAQHRRGEDKLRVQAWYEGYLCEERDVQTPAFVMSVTMNKWVIDRTQDDEDAEKEYQDFVFEEIRYRLIKTLCGNDVDGKRIYIVTLKQIRDMRCDVHKGIDEWWRRFNDFQRFLPLLTWDAGNAEGQRAKKMEEQDIRSLLMDILDESIQKKLKLDNWDLLCEDVEMLIIKVRNFEPEVKVERERES